MATATDHEKRSIIMNAEDTEEVQILNCRSV